MRFVLRPGELDGQLNEYWEDGSLGTLTEDQVYQRVRARLGLSDDLMSAFWDDIWSEYLGTPNTELIDYFAGLRRRCKTALLSNSFVGAREREQGKYGFENLTDTIVYSHEVGLSKPDPGIYLLTCRRLAVEPETVVFLDDSEIAVRGAAEVGMTALLYRSNERAIAAIETLLRDGASATSTGMQAT
jgi:putative hydrolase of the HAD superfamily